MKKLLLAAVLLLTACVFAGLYGAVHNQISYTVSPEYFTRFKFHQFRIAPVLQGRIGASIVGWMASWWMGILIGAVLIPFGLKEPRPGKCFLLMVRSYAAVAFTALVVGLSALLIAFAVIDPDMAGDIRRYGNDITDDVAFARAGTMHNFSYLGGLIGIVTGVISIRQSSKAANPRASQ